MTYRMLAILSCAALAAICVPSAPAIAACPAGTVQVGERREPQGNIVYVHPVCRRVAAPPSTASAADEAFIGSVVALARRYGWSAGKLRRFESALRTMRLTVDRAGDPARRTQVWTSMMARSANPALIAAASTGDGPGLYAAGGPQSFNDCAIFTLATATGKPYGFIAALAAGIIRDGDWRSAEHRAHPQQAMEGVGLLAEEVVMLTEALGQAEIVPPSMFSATLRSGRAVMVSVYLPGGGLHRFVLSKGFRHDGADWYEIVDSNQSAQRRLYASADELGGILRLNGVSYRPDPGTIVDPRR